MRWMILTRILVGIILGALLNISAHAVRMPPTTTYNLTLAWYPSPSPQVVSCKLYHGTASGEYSEVVEVGNVTSVTVSNLLPGVTYYFAITAVDATGQESDFSNEASYRQELPPTPTTAVQLQLARDPDGSVRLQLAGPPSRTYDVEASEDFVAWTVIGTATLDADGSLDFTDTDAVNFEQRFYRAREAQPPQPTAPPAQLTIQRSPDGQIILTAAGPADRSYNVEATEDFLSWTAIGAVTLDADGTANFTDPEAAHFPQRFYRMQEIQP